MSHDIQSVRVVDLTKTDISVFDKNLADCVILTHDRKLLLQQRPVNWGRWGGCLNAFGGHVEEGETIMQALIRELNEELGAQVLEEDVVNIGAVSEDWTGHKELVHVHFWQDRNRTITGCYEGEAVHYGDVSEALKHPKIMDYTRWALHECQNRGFL
ncbi:MAG: NUDIX domain-containing protein [Rhodospirillales bacterium]|nr:NUDIX domain-containing protein [Alphaproteobacteria bacterium]USO04541.1 MAG: NUDIX domain-containing protein [Rhodospirillales bacterium]